MHANADPVDGRHEPSPQVPTALAVLLVVLSLLVAGGAWVAVATRGGDAEAGSEDAQTATAAAPRALPSTLADLATTTHLAGPEAVTVVTELHIGDVPVDAAEIADYGGGQILVWVSWSAEPAEDLVDRMTLAIAEGGTPFSTPRPSGAGDGVWATVGNGQTHLYFARDGAVWWLAADADLAREAVTELLEVAG
jgi:hypothetical protein